LRRALAIEETAQGPDDPGGAYILDNIGSLFCRKAGTRKLNLSSSASNYRGKCFGGQMQPSSWAKPVLQKSGHANYVMKASTRLLKLFTDAPWRFGRKPMGLDHPDVASVLNNLGTLRQTGGLITQPLNSSSIALSQSGKRHLGRNTRKWRQALNNLASVFHREGRYSEPNSCFSAR